MANYRYHIPEYGRGNHYRNCSQNPGGQMQRQIHQPCAEQDTGAPVSCRTVRENCDESKKHHHNHCMEGFPIAMAYVPCQEWKNLYEVKKGFCCGTIFGELDKPFRGMGGVC